MSRSTLESFLGNRSPGSRAGGRGRGGGSAGLHERAQRCHVFLDLLQALKRAELGQLSEKLAVLLRLRRILMLKLRDEQRQEGVTPERILLRCRGRAGCRTGGRVHSGN